METIFQKRAYELSQYIQLLSTEPGYEDPNAIWLAIDKNGWPEAKRFSFSELVTLIITPNNEYYLNAGEPYIDESDVLANFPIEFRTPYYTVNIDGVEYWFASDLTTLTVKFEALVISANAITNAMLSNAMPEGTILARLVGSGNPEYITLAALRAALNIPSTTAVATQNVFTIKFPSGDVAARCSGVLSIVDGWTVAPGNNPNDLVVTHNLGREIASVNIWAIEPAGKTELRGNMANSGVVASDSNSVTIRSFATIPFPITLHLIFE